MKQWLKAFHREVGMWRTDIRASYLGRNGDLWLGRAESKASLKGGDWGFLEYPKSVEERNEAVKPRSFLQARVYVNSQMPLEVYVLFCAGGFYRIT